MDDSQKSQRITRNQTRRSFIGSAVVGGVLFGASVGGSASRSLEDRAPNEEELRIRGKKTIRTQVDPENITVVTEKTSPELMERYEKKRLTETKTYDRPNPDEDEYSAKETVIKETEWDTLVGTKGEWDDYYAENLPDSTEDEVNVQSAVNVQGSYASAVPDYYHKLNDGVWEQSGPINLLGEGFPNPDTLATRIVIANEHDNGGTTDWTAGSLGIPEWTRHLYDPDTGEYRAHDSSIASSHLGIRGRTHARIWETPNHDVVMAMGAHIDDSIPHEAVSYLDAEYEIVDKVNEGDNHIGENMYGTKDTKNFDNGGSLDHNGKASLIYEVD